jgi:hypothetical protein
MTIGSLGTIGTTVTQALKEATAAAASSAGGTGEASRSAGASGARAKDTWSISTPAQLISKLQDLQKSEPSAFKDVMRSASDKVGVAAEAASDPQVKSGLLEISAQLKAASSTGDLSALRAPPGAAGPQGARPAGGGHGGGAPPAGGPPPGGAPPGGGGATGGGGGSGASGSASASKTYEPADTNQDGKVSLQEQVVYAAKQAAEKEAAEKYAARAQTGKEDAPIGASVTSSVASALSELSPR